MNTPHNTSNSVHSLFREAATERPSYTEIDTRRDMVRAADATLFTRILTLSSLWKGPIIMTLSTALAAASLSLALLQTTGHTTEQSTGQAALQPSSQSTSSPSSNQDVKSHTVSIQTSPKNNGTSSSTAICTKKPYKNTSSSIAQTSSGGAPMLFRLESEDKDSPSNTNGCCGPKPTRTVIVKSTVDSGSDGQVKEENTITIANGSPSMKIVSHGGSGKNHVVELRRIIRKNSAEGDTHDTINVEAKAMIWTDTLFANKTVLCDRDTIVRLNVSTNETPSIGISGIGTVMSTGKVGPNIDVSKRTAMSADDYLSAIGIEYKNGNYFFNDGSKHVVPGMHIDRYLSRMDNTIHIDWCRTNDTVVREQDKPKVSFRPMYIVDSTGRIMEFCDAAINTTGKLDASEQNIIRYRDSCVTVVVHPDGKTPVYLLYYPSKEFLAALPREKSLQVLAEQGNADALRELQDSYRGCRYMSFCSTSNGAIEDTEILGSMSTDTRVKITLREPRVVRVAMYDIVGRLVAEVDKGSSYTAGEHVIPLSVRRESNQPATFYLLCITTDAGEKVSQRVVLGD